MADPEPGDAAAEDAVLVDEGAFRIDRKRTLDKLMRYQLPDPAMYVLLLVRCAVAGGATRVAFQRLESAAGGVEVRFDGAPFTAVELEYPYAGLFQGARQGGRRGRELALALLSLLRLEPKRITVLSGLKKERILLQVESLESESIAPAEDGGTLTVLRAIPRLGGKALWDGHSADLLRDYCRQCPIPITAAGSEVPRGIPKERRICPFPIEEGGVRGWIDVPWGLWTRSDVSTAWFGVAAGAIQESLSAVQVVGEVNDDRFQPNASQTLVVRNAEYRRVMGILSRNADRLLLAAIEMQNRRMDAVCGALDVAPLRQHWARQLELAGRKQDPGWFTRLARFIGGMAIPPEWTDNAAAMELDVRRTLWLRAAACRLLTAWDKDRKDELRRALWDARLLVGADLKSISLTDLVKQKEVMGYVPWSALPFPGLETSFCSVWQTHPGELDFAAALLGRKLVEVSELLEKSSRDGILGPGPARGTPVLEQIGMTDLALRLPFTEGDCSGEIGLRFSRGGANIHLFERGLPVSYTESPRPLHFVAAVTGTGDPEEGAAAALKAALRLYERAAQVFSPMARSDESRALRSHLIDFLEWACAGAKGPLPEEQSWIAQVLLWTERTEGGTWSHQKMTEAVACGQHLFFSRGAETGFAASRVFEDPRFSAQFLKRLFPECGVSAFPGKSDLWLVYRRSPSGCAHRAAGGCLVEWQSLHLALGGGEGGMEVRQPWGSAWMFGSLSPVRSLPDEAGLALLTALLRERGTLLDRPQDPVRRCLLKAVRYFYAPPWKSPAAGSLAHRRFYELASRLPFFRRPGGTWTLIELETLLTRSLPLFYRKDGSGKPGGEDCVILSDEELSLAQALWPTRKSQLEPVAEAYAPESPMAPAPPLLEWKGAPAAPAVPAGDPLDAGFGEPMLYELILSLGALRARLGLAEEALPGVSVEWTVRGKSFRFLLAPKELNLAGKVRLDVSGYAGPLLQREALHPDLAKGVLVLFYRFLCDLLVAWPGFDLATRASGGLQQVLLLLVQPAPEGVGKPPAAWEDLRRRIQALQMFPTSDGGRASLDSLRRRLVTGEPLRYLKAMPAQVQPGGAFFPVLLHPELVSAAMGGVALAAVGPGRPPAAAAEPPAAPEEEPPTPAAAGSPGETVVGEALDLFGSLGGRRGVDRSGCPPAEGLRMLPGQAPELFTICRNGRWDVNETHPMVRAVLASGLPAETQGAYLVSMVYTAANRKLSSVTDSEDACFQAVLADELCRRS